MSTTTLTIPDKNIDVVARLIRANKVKHLPFRKLATAYEITLLEEHAIASFLQLKYN